MTVLLQAIVKASIVVLEQKQLADIALAGGGCCSCQALLTPAVLCAAGYKLTATEQRREIRQVSHT